MKSRCHMPTHKQIIHSQCSCKPSMCSWCADAEQLMQLFFSCTQLDCLMALHWYFASMALPVLLCSFLIQYLVHLNASQLKQPDEFLHRLQTPAPVMLILWTASWYSWGSSSSLMQSLSTRNLIASCWSTLNASPLANLLSATFRCFCMASNACQPGDCMERPILEHVSDIAFLMEMVWFEWIPHEKPNGFTQLLWSWAFSPFCLIFSAWSCISLVNLGCSSFNAPVIFTKRWCQAQPMCSGHPMAAGP